MLAIGQILSRRSRVRSSRTLPVLSVAADSKRSLASLFAITLLVKLYDLHRQPPLGLRLSLGGYFAYLPNGFWLVLRREPSRSPRDLDLSRLRFKAPAALLSALPCVFLSGLVHEYVFGIASGRVQGWQLLFFLLQGLAVVVTRRIRPRGRITLLWVVGTWVFNLASSVLFFLSVNQVLPFYWVPDS
jgi:hypothetical protein